MAGFNVQHQFSYEPYWLAESGVDYANDGVFSPSKYEIPDEVYVEKMVSILGGPPHIGVPPEPTQITNGVFLGTSAQAENLDLLKRLRITHLLNVAGLPPGLRHQRAERFRDVPVTYEELPLDDMEYFDIWPYFQPAYSYINYGRMGGRVLIYDTGVSRGGAIALAFLIRDGNRLLDATQRLKTQRRVTLSNRGFMAQLVRLARTYGHLDADPDVIKTPRFGGRFDRYRLNSSYLSIV